MEHFLIFGRILILTFGFAVCLEGIQVYRAHRFPAVRAFVFFIALLNLRGLLSLISLYLLRNVGLLTSDGMYILVVMIMGSLGCAHAMIEIVAFASTVWHLSGSGCTPRWLALIYGTICTILLAGMVNGSHRFFSNDDREFLLSVFDLARGAMIALFSILPMYLLLVSGRIRENRRRTLAQAFGLFFLSLSCLEIGSLLFTSAWGVGASLVAPLLINIGLLAHMKPFVETYYGRAAAGREPGLTFEPLCEEFQLSARERDIVRMILKGMSNREIEQELYISSHTVKNHIYHVFQKTRARSRSHLVSMILHNTGDPANGLQPEEVEIGSFDRSNLRVEGVIR
jgi:DNA-binding CsgD family transcriptional regulator